MFSKYLKFIKGDKSGGDKAAPVSTASSSGSAIPLHDAHPEVPFDDAIDTRHFDEDNVVANIPAIATHGQRTNPEALRQKIIGRQPVLDRTQRIIGYELLLRSKTLPMVKAPDEAVRRMQDEALIRCVVDLDVSRLLEDKLAFVSVSADMLTSPLLQRLPSNGVVLAVRPDQGNLDDNLLWCRELKRLGYQIALDDFELKQGLGQFLLFASFIRVDVTRYNAIELGNLTDHFVDMPMPQLLAKSVETDDDFDACYKMHFQCFEGNYFTQLRPSMPARLDSDRIRVLDLLNKVKNEEEISLLEEGFKHDAMLSFKLLRYINSPANGFRQPIRSIAHALVILGYKQLYRWLTLLLFTSGQADARSKALMQNALVRARMTELLGQDKLPPAEREGLFIVGIFSLLDVLLNVPMEQALEQLQLPAPVVAALVRREGIYAPYLSLAVACEEADQDAIVEHATSCGLDAHEVNIAQVKALVWAEEMDL